MKDWILKAFDYDAWANMRWAEALRERSPALVGPDAMSVMTIPAPWPDFPTHDPLARASAVFTHLLWAERTWLLRCGVDVHPEDGDAETWIDQLNKGWKGYIEETALDIPIPYRNGQGEAFVRPVGEIALHVINHGTYHRGQLREIAPHLPVEDFPGTDLIGFFFVTNPL